MRGKLSRIIFLILIPVISGILIRHANFAFGHKIHQEFYMASIEILIILFIAAYVDSQIFRKLQKRKIGEVSLNYSVCALTGIFANLWALAFGSTVFLFVLSVWGLVSVIFQFYITVLDPVLNDLLNRSN